MIKRVIFDLDNTLIPFPKDIWKSLNDALYEINIDYSDEDIKKLIGAILVYEDNYDKYAKDSMLVEMRNCSKLKLPDNFIDTWLKYLKNYYPQEKDIALLKTLEYLSNKYELIVLTNFFTESQEGRLKNYGISKYFKNIIGTDKIPNKPCKDAFIFACGPYKPNECIMIGDSLKTDIYGALEVDMDAILVSDNYYEGIKTIKSLEELMNIL